jgi:hypothetical protein
VEKSFKEADSIQLTANSLRSATPRGNVLSASISPLKGKTRKLVNLEDVPLLYKEV